MKKDSYVFQNETDAKEWIAARRLDLMAYSPTFDQPYYCELNKGWVVTMTTFGAD